jgi:hypothetical protein
MSSDRSFYPEIPQKQCSPVVDDRLFGPEVYSLEFPDRKTGTISVRVGETNKLGRPDKEHLVGMKKENKKNAKCMLETYQKWPDQYPEPEYKSADGSVHPSFGIHKTYTDAHNFAQRLKDEKEIKLKIENTFSMILLNGETF